MAQTHRILKALGSLQSCHRLSVRALFPSRPFILVPPRNPRIFINQRGLSVTPQRHATLAPSLPTQPTVVLCTPSPEYIEKEELDVELLPPDQAKLEITDRAAEQLSKIAEREHNPEAALRISVESGGCHGYQYNMKLATSRSPDDYLFCHPSIIPSNILVDAVSFSLLNGSTIDFATELIGSSFRVSHNPFAKGSGCGCGVSWELKDT